MVAALVERKIFVYLCTNAVLLRRRLDRFTPSPYFAFVVHIDGLRERHDEAVDRDGVFDEAVAAIREAQASRGSGSPPTRRSSTPTRPRRCATCSTSSTTSSASTP